MLKTFKPFLLGFTIESTGLLSGVSCAKAHQTLFLVDCNLVAMISLSPLLSPQQEFDRGPACNFYEINPFSKPFFPFTLHIRMPCLQVYLSVHHVHDWCSQRPEGVGSLGIGVTDACKLPHGVWEPNLDPLQDSSILNC